MPATMPKSVLVIGSGAIGIEFASFYRDMGAEVTVVEVLDRIVPVEDEEISAFARKALRKAGHEDLHRRRGEGLEGQADSVTATIEAGGKTVEITVERVISRSASSAMSRISASRARRSRSRRAISSSTNGSRTDEPGVYAIGDVVGPPWLAHKASHEGVVCVEKIAGRQRRASARTPSKSPAAPIACRRSPASA